MLLCTGGTTYYSSSPAKFTGRVREFGIFGSANEPVPQGGDDMGMPRNLCCHVSHAAQYNLIFCRPISC